MPSIADIPTSKAVKHPPIKVKLTPAALDAVLKTHYGQQKAQEAIKLVVDKLNDDQVNAIRVLLECGQSRDAICKTLHVTKQQVAAVAAHVTMGTYGAPANSKSANSKSASSVKQHSKHQIAKPAKRAFYLDE